jgi:membrane-associated phospholipid phosphatase
VALLIGRQCRRPARVALTGLAVGLAVAVAASRVLLDVHWLTDVIAGLALGWAWFSVCAVAFGGRLLRFGAGAETAERAADAKAQGKPRPQARVRLS